MNESEFKAPQRVNVFLAFSLLFESFHRNNQMIGKMLRKYIFVYVNHL